MSWDLLYALDLVALMSFVFSYYFHCYRRGYRIDIWHVQLFLMCVLPNMLMLPFSKGELNYPVLRSDFPSVVASLPTIFLITLLGYFSLFAGGFFWHIRTGLGIRKLTMRFLDFVPECSIMVMSSPTVLVFQTGICVLLQAMILGYYFSQSGFGFDLRQFTFANPALRPVALLISTYSVFIGSHCFARYVEKKERKLLLCALLLSFGLMFFGSRGSVIGVYLGVLVCYLIQLRNRISLFRIFGVVFLLLFIALYLGSVRSGDYSLTDFFQIFIMLLLYGNNFSDLRDFAWVYAHWDHHFWLGKTYLAAVTSFVPRFASEFRDQWGLGAATALTVGFDPHVHPGLRPGAFGEGYLNFGVVGVIAVGFVVGMIMYRVDMGVKQALASRHPSMMKAFAMSSLLGISSVITLSAGFSSLFVLAGIYFFNWCCIRLWHMLQHRSSSIVTV